MGKGCSGRNSNKEELMGRGEIRTPSRSHYRILEFIVSKERKDEGQNEAHPDF